MRSKVRLEHVREEYEARLRAMEHFENTEKANRLQEYHIIEAGVSPKFYDDKLVWINSRTCEGTEKWLKRSTTLAKWLDFSKKPSKVLWLQGIPGAGKHETSMYHLGFDMPLMVQIGKTFLSASIIALARNTSRVIFAFLSHIYGSTSALSVLHSLTFQLAGESSDLQASLIESSRENLRNDITVAARLLKMLLNCAGPVYIVIDGVDEIEQDERSILIRQLLDLLCDCPDARILISCRADGDIARILTPSSDIIRVDEHNAGSIQAFITKQSRRWLEMRNFHPAERVEIEGLLAPIAANAEGSSQKPASTSRRNERTNEEGMFLYAKVILSGFEYLTDVNSVREELKVLPESLDAA